MKSTIGIDISKERLDTYALASGEHRQFPNNAAGHRALLKWTKVQHCELVVFEPSGAYHRQIEITLAAREIPFAKVNPRQARRFAEAIGKLAKTDRVDAAMLARMGAVLALEARSPCERKIYVLRDLLVARRALIKDQTAARSRQKTCTQPVLKRQIAARLKQIEKHLAELDAAVLEAVRADQDLAHRFEILKSIPGVGEITAMAILIEMPELGTLNAKEAASLAGLAPATRQSGNWQGNERIQGGRSALRHSIFMPALTAIRYNDEFRAKYSALITAGKAPKVAVTAVMRKIIVLANALIRDGRKWTPHPA